MPQREPLPRIRTSNTARSSRLAWIASAFSIWIAACGPAPRTASAPAVALPAAPPEPAVAPVSLPPPPAPLDAPAASAPAPPPALPRDPWRANEDPADDFVVAPPELIPDCETRLASAGVTWRPGSIRVRPSPNGKHSCGAPQVVIYDRGPSGAKWNAGPVVTCGLAIALARFEGVLQEEAQRFFSQRVVRINQGGTYSCRKMANYDWVSEHSYANAIDFFTFTLADSRVVSVERHFGKTDQPAPTLEGQFLRTLARRLYTDGIFSNVLTPYFDALHRNHIHVDLARYRNDGTQ